MTVVTPISVGFHCAVLLAMPVLCSATENHKQDMGVVGRLYEIAEEDLLQRMQEQMTAHAAEAGQPSGEARRRAERYIHRPPGLSLPRAVTDSTRRWKPQWRVPHDIRDAEGRLLYMAGTVINPLQRSAFDGRLIFADGNDPAQVLWLRAQAAASTLSTRIILVAGAPMELRRRWQRPVYFDQGGALSRKLGISALPTLLTRQDDALVLREIVLDEAGLPVQADRKGPE